MTAQAAMMPATIDLVGDSSLSRRPNEPLLDTLRALGAEVESTQGRALIRCVPSARRGRLPPWASPALECASALVLALPFAEFGSVVTVESPVHSRPYLDLTIAMAQQAGLSVVLSEFAGGDLRTAIPGQQSVSASSPTVGADWSTAAGDGCGAVERRLGTPRRSRPKERPRRSTHPRSPRWVRRIDNPPHRRLDRASRYRAEQSGAHRRLGDRPVPATVCDRSDCEGADAAPKLGSSPQRVRSYRRHGARGCEPAGIEYKERSDALLITGGRPRAADYSAEGDHRVHMALCALALAADEPSTVDGTWSTVISYPGFHTDLGSL